MFYNVTDITEVDAVLNDLYSNFLAQIAPGVTTLMNEYRRKKDAWQQADRRYIKEGELDMERLAHYRTSDDIFKTTILNRKGKSHGIVMEIDWSSSMQFRQHAVAQQAITTAVFAQNCKLPYRIYAMRTNRGGDGEQGAGDPTIQNSIRFSENHLKLMASSEGNIEQNNKQLFALWMVTLINEGYRSMENHYAVTMEQKAVLEDVCNLCRSVSPTNPALGVTDNEKLNKLVELCQNNTTRWSTSLFSSIFALTNIVREFKSKHRLQNVTVMILTDGEDTDSLSTDNGNIISNYDGVRIRDSASVLIDSASNRMFDLSSLVSHDNYTGFTKPMGYPMTCSIAVNFLRMCTGAKVVAVSLDDQLQSAVSSFVGGAQFRSEAKEIIMAKYKENDNRYVKLDHMLGYDAVVFATTTAISSNKPVEDQDKLIEERRKLAEHSQSIIEAGMSSDLLDAKFQCLLARDIASIIVKDFDVIKKPQINWLGENVQESD